MNTLGTLCGACLLAAGLSGQAMCSGGYFLSSVELASGGTCASATYANVIAVGAGAVPVAMGSSSYRFAGGYAATLDVPTTGQPWVTHVSPGRVTTNGGATLTLHGNDLDLGTDPTITIGGKRAAFVSRTASRIVATQPALTAPGFPVVEVGNDLGTTGVARSLGVLPLLACDPAPAPGVRFDLRFHGTQGDRVFWAVGVQPVAPIPLPGILHGLGIHPGLMLVGPPLVITAADGVFRMAVPPTPYTGPVFVQAVFAGVNPGYAPGSFSNVIRL